MPSIPANLDWVFFAIGGVVALGAIWLLVWALFRDRARGKFRCPRCWYDLTPANGEPVLPVTCSECGRVVTKPKHLKKTRARWRWAMVALVMAPVAGVIAYYPSGQRNGWLSILPTRFLIDSMPVFGYPSPLTDELVRRHGVLGSFPGRTNPALRTVSLEDDIYLAKRILEGTRGARPISERWKSTLGQFLNDFSFQLFPPRAHGTNSPPMDPALAAALEKLFAIPPEFELRTRPVWPQGVPLWVETKQNQWWPNMGLSWRLEYQRRPGPWKTLESEKGIVVRQQGLNPEGSLEFLVRMEWSGGTNYDSATTVFDHKINSAFSIPYKIAGTIDDILTPVSDAQLDHLVSMMKIYAEYFNVENDATRAPATAGIGFGVIIEFIRDGEVKHSQRRWWLGGVATQYFFGRGDFEWIREPPQGRSKTAFPGENWTVRIRSDPETALRVIDADKYWQGDVTIPLTIR